MFSNRGYAAKLAAALAVIAGMGVWCAKRGDTINPALWRCVVEPRRWDGTRLWVPAARIVSSRQDEYEIQTAELRIRVVGRPPAEPGRSVSLAGVFRADGSSRSAPTSRVSAPTPAGSRSWSR